MQKIGQVCILIAGLCHVLLAKDNDVQFRFYDAPLGIIIEQLNQNLDTEYRLESDLAAKIVSIELAPLSAQEALAEITKRFQLIEKPAEGFTWLIKKELITKKLVPEPKTSVPKTTKQITQTRQLSQPQYLHVYAPLHTNVQSFLPLLSSPLGGILQPKSIVRTDTANNLLMVKATEQEHAEVTSIISALDTPTKVVRVYSRILIARKQAQQELGRRMGIHLRSGNFGFISGVNQSVTNQGLTDNLAIDFGVVGEGSAALLAYSNANDTLSLEIQALESSGAVDVVATPQVLVNSGETAYIATGSQVPYVIANGDDGQDVEFKDAVLSLKVTPNVESDTRIALDIAFAMDSVGVLYTSFPSIKTNKLSTLVTMQPGQTLVLGGVFLQTASSVEAKTPLFGDIPLLGSLFRYSVKSMEEAELIVFLTPVLESNLLAR